MARWVSPVPRSTVWWVSSSRSTTSAGSSSWRRCSALASLSSSAWVLATTAVASTGAGCSIGSTWTGWPFGRQRVAGGGVGELGHAADVAGGQRVDRLVVLAAHDEQAVEPLVGAGAAVHEVVVVADRARQHLEQRDLPDERVGDRLEHHRERVGRRDRRAPRPRCRRRARWSGRSAGGGPISTRRSASRSMPDLGGGRAAHDREHAGRLDAEREGVLELLERRARRPRGSARAGRRRRRRCPPPGCRAPGARAPPCRRGSARCGGRRPRRGGRCR